MINKYTVKTEKIRDGEDAIKFKSEYLFIKNVE